MRNTHINTLVYLGGPSLQELEEALTNHQVKNKRLPLRIFLPEPIYRWYDASIPEEGRRRSLRFKGIRIEEL